MAAFIEGAGASHFVPAMRGIEGWLNGSWFDRPSIVAAAQDIGYSGVSAFLKVDFGSALTDVALDGHLLSINLTGDRFSQQLKAGEKWSEISPPFRSISILAAGDKFSSRHSGKAVWAGLLISPARLEALLGGRRLTFRSGYGFKDDLLADIMSALLHQTSNSVRTNELSKALVHSAAIALGERHGVSLPHVGGITNYDLAMLTSWIEANIAGDISIRRLAKIAGYSEAHFSREFKRTTGMTPWDYVIETRVNRACALLRGGGNICRVAQECGFADSAHLSRTLKSRRGVSPATVRRRGNAGD